MKNSEYWEKRIANNIWSTYNSLEEKNRALLEMYQEASLNISEELYKVTEKINQGKGITLSDMYKSNRLGNLQNNIEKIIRGLGENVETFGKDNMFKGCKDTYTNTMVELGKVKFDMVPKKVMEEMLRRPWEGSNFSTRLWKNTQVLSRNLNELLTDGLTQGKTIAEISINLSNTMNQGFNVSHRLIRTETMHYLNESAFKGYVNAGCNEVQLWAATDERTCKICGSKHGNIYKVKNRPTLPLHANCRCTYLPVIDEESTPSNNSKDNTNKRTWHNTEFTKVEYSNKKDITNHLKNKYSFKFSDSRKYPIDIGIYSDCANWVDKFEAHFEGFNSINPVKLNNINIKVNTGNAVGYYSYYLDSPKVEELVLNARYFTDRVFNQSYIDKCKASGWTVANAEGYKTFVHEYGHHVANSLKWMEGYQGTSNEWCKIFVDDVIKEYNKKYKREISFKDISNVVSQYGGTKTGEAYAETFAEYFGGENPREFAQVFGEMCEERISKQLGG